MAEELKLDLRFHQSNREYEIIDWIHAAREVAGGIVINPAAFTHTSVAILDALNTFDSASGRNPHLERAQAGGIPASTPLFCCERTGSSRASAPRATSWPCAGSRG